MNLYLISLAFSQIIQAREQYPWDGSGELAQDVDLLLKQGLKIGYLPKTSQNGNTQSNRLGNKLLTKLRNKSFA